MFPATTATFLFTDIEGSTKRWESDPSAMSATLARHDQVVRDAIESYDGEIFKTVGDAFCAVFGSARAALEAALTVQCALAAVDWSAFAADLGELRVRVAIHSGEAERRAGDYFGRPVNRVARLLAVGHGGQILLSESTFDLVRDDLPPDMTLQDLGEHRLKDLARPERVYQVVVPGLRSEFPVLRSLDLHPHNLPVQLTTFVGREREVDAIMALLKRSRLVTLTGIGGGGKTRLALQAAAEVVDEFPDGVWFVDQSALTDGGLVAETVATVLGLREEPRRTIEETLLGYVREKRMLILLDNCEQVVDVCADLVAKLLGAAAGVRVLATSREVLRVPGEAVWTVPPLTMPDATHAASVDPASLSQYEAVRLFIDRAVGVRADFAVTNANAPSVAGICLRLEGIPLAIELAATRVRALTPDEILVRLDDRLRLLSGGPRTAPARQQTLRATLEWSHDLLTAEEQALFRRLAVFRGGWTLEAVESVSEGNGIERSRVLDLVTELVDRSLVVHCHDGIAGRDRYLETVGQYAQERLDAAGETEWANGRHLAYYRAMGEVAEAACKGPDAPLWMSRLDAEHDNVRAALDWAAACGDAEAGLALAMSVSEFWSVRGYWTEGRALLDRAIRAASGGGLERRSAMCLDRAAGLASDQGDWAAAQVAYEESLAMWRRLGCSREEATTLSNSGLLATSMGDYATSETRLRQGLAYFTEHGPELAVASVLVALAANAGQQGRIDDSTRDLYEAALAIFRKVGNVQGIATALYNLGCLSYLNGDHEASHEQFAQALTQAERLGDKPFAANCLLGIGKVAKERGDREEAQSRIAESLASFRELGDVRNAVCAMTALGELAEFRGDIDAASAAYRESAALAVHIGDRRAVADLLNGFGRLAQATGRPRRAARLIAAAAALQADAGLGGGLLPPSERDIMAKCCAQARIDLSDVVFDALSADGRAMTMDEAIAYALETMTPETEQDAPNHA